MNWSKPALVAGLSLSCFSLRALTINATYDSTVTSQPNAAQIESAFGTAVQVLQTLYTNPITVNITVVWGAGSLGQSSGHLVGNPTYSQIVSALSSMRTTLADTNAVKSLPASDPVPGTNHVWWIPRPEAKALGMTYLGVSANDTGNDGSVYFDSAVTWTFDPNNRAVPGAYDFISVAEHEITEVLGRTSDLNVNPTGGYVPLDLFHFTASNTRTFVPNVSGAYFSVNNGTNVLKYFSTTSDSQDWLSGSDSDSFNASLTQGSKGLLSLADLTVLDILGYNLNFKAPRLKAVPLTNGNFELTFTNVTGLNFGVLATTNLVAGPWVNLGNAGESTAGHYQFIDTQTSANKKRFYAVVLQ